MNDRPLVADDVSEAIEEAAAAACRVLDVSFPGFDAGGITSNFQGGLRIILAEMLAGRSPLVNNRPVTTHLPALLVSDSMLGDAYAAGSGFLAVRWSRPDWVPDVPGTAYPGSMRAHIQAIGPDGGDFANIDTMGDAWTSFDAAREGLLRHARERGVTAAALARGYATIAAVETIPGHEVGYTLVQKAALSFGKTVPATLRFAVAPGA